MTLNCSGRPRICLSMIVRDEAPVVHELVASVAAFIDSWVIVDTGSTDGTQDLVRRLMAERGIPGELHERPWRDFGSNRTEALTLAQGHADYIWVMDADDRLVGTPDFSGLEADAYSLRIRDGVTSWRLQLFRDGVPWYYTGVLHEVAACDAPHVWKRLEGDYHVHSRRLGARSHLNAGDLAEKSMGEADPSPASPLRPALTQKLLSRAVVHGEIRLPAVPAMIDAYCTLCERTFAAVGVAFDADQLAQLRGAIEGQLATAYAASPRSEIVITYDSPIGSMVNYHVKAQWLSVGAAYDAWVATRQPPYFGTSADARVLALANEAADPSACPVLDIGAGTGRNALALARRGHPVDAVEMSGQFAAILRSEAERHSLPVRVLERDVGAGRDGLRHDYGLVVLSEVASDFRSVAQLRDVFDLAAAVLAAGGRLVLNVFLPRGGYEPDAAAREFGQQVYSAIFTRAEVATAAAGLPLELVGDDPVHEYEKGHLPEGGWPPTGWYADWTSGLDVFAIDRRESPIEMRWLVYRKPAAHASRPSSPPA